MFGSRRHRQPYTPPTAATVNPNAATAAASAYQLSSAAAAAALRALPHPPTNVAEVQTKRTQRRSASVSSQGSRRGLSPAPSRKAKGGRGAASPSPHGRRNSSTSLERGPMVERTFRSPSPGRPALGASQDAQTAAGAAAANAIRGHTPRPSDDTTNSSSIPPPVPSIPKQHSSTTSTQTKRTSLGLVQQPLKLASQKIKDGQGSWFGGARVGDLSNVRRDDAMNINNKQRAPAPAPISTTQERPGSRNSAVNFSYPARLRVASPSGSPPDDYIGEPSSPVVAIPAGHPPKRAASVEREPHQTHQRGAAAKHHVQRSASTSRATTVHNHHPSASADSSDQTLVYDPNSRRMVPRAELFALEQEVIEVAERKRLRKKRQSPSRAGSYSGRNSLPRSARQEEPLPEKQQQQQQQYQVPAAVLAEAALPVDDPREAAVEEPAAAVYNDEPAQPASTDFAESMEPEEPADYTQEPEPVSPTEDVRPSLVKRPSVVREEPELEEEEELHHRHRQTAPSLGAIDETRGAPGQLREPTDQLQIGTPAVAIHSPTPQHQHETASAVSGRTHSNSPVRTAHFAPVSSSGNLTVQRHSPPPRSISPRKSALKPTSSPRDASPSDEASDVGQYNNNQLEQVPSRRKSVRVSFDDEHTVVVPQEVSSSSSLSSPSTSEPSIASSSQPDVYAQQYQQPQVQQQPQHQPQPQTTHKRTWFSNIGRSKKKDASNMEDDVVMKPRPALPSFGSVRDKSQLHSKEPEERSLVRPQAAIYGAVAGAAGAAVLAPAIIERKQQGTPQGASPQGTPPPQQQQLPPSLKQQPSLQQPPSLKQPPSQQLPPKHLEMINASSDHAIGSILTQHDSSSSLTRNTANTSRYREPLPPVVTSVDGSGYVSDAGSSTISMEESEAGLLADTPVAGSNEHLEDSIPTPPVASTSAKDFAFSNNPVETPNGNVTKAVGFQAEKDTPTTAPVRPVPVLSFTRPSQDSVMTTQSTKRNQSPTRSVYDLPGTFPEDSDSSDDKAVGPTTAGTAQSERSTAVETQPGSAQSPAAETPSPGSVPMREYTFEPSVQSDDAHHSSQTPGTVLATHMPTLPDEEAAAAAADESESESDSGVYSDAYEDLSDVEGDGFLSLDAVVESPVTASFPKNPLSVSNEPVKEVTPKSEGVGFGSGAAMLVGTAAVGTAAAARGAASTGAAASKSADDDEEDWDKVKAFWRGLSSEKRAQLENEAMEEAAVDGDLEESSAVQAKKPRRKKSVEKRAAEKRAIQGLQSGQGGQTAQGAQGVTAPPVDPIENRYQSPAQPPQAALPRIRRSMREAAAAGGAAGGGGARQTLRSPAPEKQQRKQLKQKQLQKENQQPQAQQQRSRPMSFPQGPGSSPQSKTPTKTQAQIMASALMTSSLQRKNSDSSESSFKRSRAGGGGGGMGFGSGAGLGGPGGPVNGAQFRKTMRRDSASESFNNRSSRFSLRSLSPAGSAFGNSNNNGLATNGRHANPLPSPHGSLESPQLRRTLRDSTNNAAEARRMTLSPPPPPMMASMRKNDTPAMMASMRNDGGFSSPPPAMMASMRKNESSGGFFSFGKSSGSKLSRRNKNKGSFGGDRDAFSSDEDNAGFQHTSPPRRSVSAGGANTFRSRFADSSDEDDFTVPPLPKAHAVPKTLRGGNANKTSLTKYSPPRAALTPRGPSLPEDVNEDDGYDAAAEMREMEAAFLEKKNKPKRQSLRSRRTASASGALPTVNSNQQQQQRPASSAAAAAAFTGGAAADNLGTSSLRRTRSGRGDMMVSPPPLPTAAAAMAATSMASPTTVNTGLGQSAEHHRRLSSSAGSFMSALRRKRDSSAPGDFSSGTSSKIQRGELMDSAARRDTALERSNRELAAVRRVDEEDEDTEDDELLLEDTDHEEINNTTNTHDSWPLPPGPATGQTGQVQTAAAASDDVLSNGKKKKKFPGLRKMFRLDD